MYTRAIAPLNHVRLFLALLLSCLYSCGMNPVFASTWPPVRVKLVVVIVIDQFRADFLSRYAEQFEAGGVKALTKTGAFYPLGEFDILQAMTGPGHATILTGAYPYQMGIPLNDWYDQVTRKPMYCVEDSGVKTVGLDSQEPSSSPRNLVGSTLGDELKNAGRASKVVAISIKDRAAILLGGKRADLALWIDGKPRRWVSSTYYRKDAKLPAWVEPLGAAAVACDLKTSCSADITAQAFIAALAGEKLGRGTGPDVLAVSFSGHDIAGHRFGPDAPEMKAITLAEDRAIARMRAAIDKQVGLKNTLFVLTGDHGVAPVPEDVPELGGGRVDEKVLLRKINESLTHSFGKAAKGDWVPYVNDFNFFIDEENARIAKVDLGKMQVEIKAVLAKEPAFAQIFTQAELEAGRLPPGVFGRRLLKTFYKGRTGHVVALQKPFFINAGGHRATHMTGYTYDRMVPIILSGPGIQPGLRSEKAEVVDIAPTLAFLLGVLPPALSEGRVLSEALLKAP